MGQTTPILSVSTAGASALAAESVAAVAGSDAAGALAQATMLSAMKRTRTSDSNFLIFFLLDFLMCYTNDDQIAFCFLGFLLDFHFRIDSWIFLGS
ncbi:hypothetical protein SDC9_179358 [bioreactor metagenome]|uniref:Uncharacterized protein n=1 Tax=bioreactor metagenome TaxID=1076179 RepID=A0A645H7W2_9ZZZZ